MTQNRQVIIEGKKGEYIGFSKINKNKLHFFSMYDGSVIKKFSFYNVDFVDGKPSRQFEAPKQL
jgi:hypothetical protein